MINELDYKRNKELIAVRKELIGKVYLKLNIDSEKIFDSVENMAKAVKIQGMSNQKLQELLNQ